MTTTPYVNSSIRSTIPNTRENAQHIVIKVLYDHGRVESIEAYAPPIFSYNYNAKYENRNDILPKPIDGHIRPISMFNYNNGFWNSSENVHIDRDHIYCNDCVWSPICYYPTLRDFLTHIREIYNYDGEITGTDWLCRPALTREPVYDREITLKSVSSIVMELIDKNSANLPEGDYLKICDELKRIRNL